MKKWSLIKKVLATLYYRRFGKFTKINVYFKNAFVDFDSIISDITYIPLESLNIMIIKGVYVLNALNI